MSRARANIAKYLERYAEPEAARIPSTERTWRHVLCIPATQEATSLPDTIRSASQAEEAAQALLVVVVNARETASEEVHRSNEDTLRWLGGQGTMRWTQAEGLDVLVVERASPGRYLPEGQGVGLARKIAGDVALSLIASGTLQTTWIRFTDADVFLPSDFFQRLTRPLHGVSATLMPYTHRLEGPTHQQAAMRRYDAFLSQYTAGLRRAGSPYAYAAIGSLISVNTEAYAAVRGVPKRLAGEDFYLLNKLAKVGSVQQLDGAPVIIRGRLSDRVPFGTGAALGQLMGGGPSAKTFRGYDPRVFDGLGLWLSMLRRFAAEPERVSLTTLLDQVDGPIGIALRSAVSELGAVEAAERAREQARGPALLRRLMEWNDAFRTLKLIHGMRGAGLDGEVRT